MKLYTPPEMSKKLVALGCVPRSEMFWVNNFRTPDEFKLVYDDNYDHIYWNWLDLPAFEFEDFASVEEFSIRNRMSLSWTTRDKILQSNNWVEEVGRGL